MSEKTTLLPTAPSFVDGSPNPQQPSQEPHQHATIPMPRIILAPGLELDPSRKYRYGTHALLSALLILISFALVEMRSCYLGPGIDLKTLQALHIALMIFALVLYLMSLFGIADFLFQYKLFFLAGVMLVYVFVGLMIWMTYEAAVNPCVGTFNAYVDMSFGAKNVFSRGDGVGIVVLFLDIFATIFMISAAASFYKRY